MLQLCYYCTNRDDTYGATLQNILRIQYQFFVTSLFNLRSECLIKETLEGSGDLKIGHIINTVKYADDLVLLAKE
jgi:hypothetical protein